MKAVTRILVERLRCGLMSRNRHFQLFRRPEAREALRVHQFLRSLERDLLPVPGEAGPEVEIEVQEHADREGVTLRISLPRRHAQRTCFLSPAEYRLLLTNPELLRLLRPEG